LVAKSIGTMLRIIALIASHQPLAKLNHLIGFSLYLLDSIVYRVVRTGPSLKILFAYKD
jgi:hypothetical protein